MCAFKDPSCDPWTLPGEWSSFWTLMTSKINRPNCADYEEESIQDSDLNDFAKALNAPESSGFISLNDWKPIYKRVRRHVPARRYGKKRKAQRSKDETREGFVYMFFKWPLLIIVVGWVLVLSSLYFTIRLYIASYETLITWRGRRQGLRTDLRSKGTYLEWRDAAQQLDRHLGNEQWKQAPQYAYYDHVTIEKALRNLESRLKDVGNAKDEAGELDSAVARLKSDVEACVKYNFVGYENPRLYSETYYGTKELVQRFVDQLHSALSYLLNTPGEYPSAWFSTFWIVSKDHSLLEWKVNAPNPIQALSQAAKYSLCSHLNTNFGRSALCLSGGKANVLALNDVGVATNDSHHVQVLLLLGTTLASLEHSWTRTYCQML